MKTILKRTVAITLAFTLSFTFIPAFTGGLEAHAAAKPAKVTKLKLVKSGQTVTLTWSKVKKNLNGYTIYRNGKAIKSVGKKVLTFKEKGLAPGTTYSYYVRAYRNVKQKQWYNKKTGKWQKSKPAKKYRGKSKKVTVRLYGKASPKHSCTTDGQKPNNNPSETINKVNGTYDIKISKTSSSVTFTITSIEGNDTRVILKRGVNEIGIMDVNNKSITESGLTANTDYTYTLELEVGGVVREEKTQTITVKTAEASTEQGQ